MATNKFTVEKLSAQTTYDVNKDDGLLSVQENTGTEVSPVYEQRKIAFEDFRNLFQFGVEVYDTRDDSGDPSLPRFLPTTGVAGTSYKVERDPITSRNGYYGWSDYTSDYYYAASLNLGVIEEGNVDAVSGDTVFNNTITKALNGNICLYYCNTAASTASKTASKANADSSASVFVRSVVKFGNVNTNVAPTLNLNSKGDYPIWYNGALASETNSWGVNEFVDIIFDAQINVYRGVNFNEREDVTLNGDVCLYYCTTSGLTVEKAASKSGSSSSVSVFVRSIVKMNNFNLVDNPTLNLNSKGAYPIYYKGEAASGINTWAAGEFVDVIFDAALNIYRCEPYSDFEEKKEYGGVDTSLGRIYSEDTIMQLGVDYSMCLWFTTKNDIDTIQYVYSNRLSSPTLRAVIDGGKLYTYYNGGLNEYIADVERGKSYLLIYTSNAVYLNGERVRGWTHDASTSDAFYLGVDNAAVSGNLVFHKVLKFDRAITPTEAKSLWNSGNDYELPNEARNPDITTDGVGAIHINKSYTPDLSYTYPVLTSKSNGITHSVLTDQPTQVVIGRIDGADYYLYSNNAWDASEIEIFENSINQNFSVTVSFINLMDWIESGNVKAEFLSRNINNLVWEEQSSLFDGLLYDESNLSLQEFANTDTPLWSNVLEDNKDVETALRSLGKINTISATSVPVVYDKTLKFAFMSDMHGEYQRFLDFIQVLNYYSDNLDFVAQCGDLVRDNFTDDFSFYENNIASSKLPIINLIGNHDVGNNNIVALTGSDTEVYDRYISPYRGDWGIVQPLSKSYFYKDDADTKIRSIFIYENETDYANDGTTLTYFRGRRVFSQAQIDWFIAILESLPSDYGVICFIHSPELYGTTENNFCDPYYPQTSPSHYGAGSILNDIIEAFIGKTTINTSFSQTGGIVGTINVVGDFSSLVDTEFISWFAGHVHSDYVGKYLNYPNQTLVSIDCNNTERDTYGDIEHISGKKSENCINFVSIDRNLGKIAIVRVGADQTATGQTRKMINVEY